MPIRKKVGILSSYMISSVIDLLFLFQMRVGVIVYAAKKYNGSLSRGLESGSTLPVQQNT